MKVWSVSTMFYCDAPASAVDMRAKGWRWLSGKRCWMTGAQKVALPLIEHADPQTRAKLEKWRAERENAIAASKAASIEIDLPAPAGLAYRPYQAAGVDFMAKRHTSLNADVPRLGKTIQTLGVVNLSADACQRMLVVCPAVAKINWQREILKWSIVPVATAVLEGNVSPEDCERFVAALRLGQEMGPEPRQEPQQVVDAVETPVVDALPRAVDVGARAPLTHLSAHNLEDVAQSAVGVLDLRDDAPVRLDGDAALAVEDPGHITDHAGVTLFQLLEAHRQISVKRSEGSHPRLHVLIVNYDIIHSWAPVLQAFAPQIRAADEAHYLKNKQSRRTKVYFDLPRPEQHEIFLTGTPIFTKPIDLWPLLQRCDPDGLGRNWFGFVKRYCDAKKIGGRWEMDGSSNEEELQFKMRSRFMIRREKSDVLAELPTQRIPIWLPKRGLEKFVKAEKNAVQANLAKLWDALKGEDVPDDVLKEFADKDSEALGTPLATARQELALAKLPMVIDFVSEQLQTEKKLVVFAYHREVVQRLHANIPNSAMIIGGMGSKARQEAIDRFRDDPLLQVTVCSIAAVREAVSLAAADTAVYAEISWIPSEMDQSEERIWDPTKEVPCTIYRLLVEDSMDGQMHERLETRQKSIARMTHAKYLNHSSFRS